MLNLNDWLVAAVTLWFHRDYWQPFCGNCEGQRDVIAALERTEHRPEEQEVKYWHLPRSFSALEISVEDY